MRGFCPGQEIWPGQNSMVRTEKPGSIATKGTTKDVSATKNQQDFFRAERSLKSFFSRPFSKFIPLLINSVSDMTRNAGEPTPNARIKRLMRGERLSRLFCYIICGRRDPAYHNLTSRKGGRTLLNNARAGTSPLFLLTNFVESGVPPTILNS